MNFPTWALQTRSYLGGVVPFELSVGGGGGRCRGFVLVQNPGNKLLNVHHSVAGQTLEHIHVDLKDKCRCFCSYCWQSERACSLRRSAYVCHFYRLISWWIDSNKWDKTRPSVDFDPHLQAQVFTESEQFSVSGTSGPRDRQLAARLAQPLLQTGRQGGDGSPGRARLIGVPEMHLTCTRGRRVIRS